MIHSKQIKLLSTSLLLTATLSSSVSLQNFRSIANADQDGPFPAEATLLDKMVYIKVIKTESSVRASSLASSSTDGTIKIVNGFSFKRQMIDPATGTPQVDAEGKPVMETITISSGTILNPNLNPNDNVMIPKGIEVNYPALANGAHSIGRFAYLGVAPRFDSSQLEMFASKMGHSLRVKAWVTEASLQKYELFLLERFNGIYKAFMDPTVHVLPLKNLKEMARKYAQGTTLNKWFTVASHYSKHTLESTNLGIYQKNLQETEYKKIILTAIIRNFMNNQSMSIEDGLKAYQQYKTDPNFLASRAEASTALFNAHLGHRYTVASDPSRPERIGYLTFVYPIAIDKAGPFKLPRPGIKKFPLATSIEGRWWSNRWNAEFGGLPFLQVTADGVAFHSPITAVNTNNLDTWFLRRDDVSHSCMRMDASDILELRALIPAQMNKLQGLGRTIPLIITEGPDVTDVDNNGTMEVVDVAYYAVPTLSTTINNPENWKPESYNKIYWNKIFGTHANKTQRFSTNISGVSSEGVDSNAATTSNFKFTFKVTSRNEIDPATGATKVINRGEFTGLPKYENMNGNLTITGIHAGVLPIMTLPQRPTAIIQYREDGTLYTDPNSGGGDYQTGKPGGKYSPMYFNTLPNWPLQ